MRQGRKKAPGLCKNAGHQQLLAFAQVIISSKDWKGQGKQGALSLSPDCAAVHVAQIPWPADKPMVLLDEHYTWLRPLSEGEIPHHWLADSSLPPRAALQGAAKKSAN